MSIKASAATATALLLLTTAHASAQEVSCGGIGDGADWIGGTASGSDIAAVSAPFATAVQAPNGGYGVTLFSLSAPMDIRVEAQPQGGRGDTVLELYDTNGRLVVQDDDSGGGLSSRAELDLQPGNYCLAVRGFADAAVNADVQVSRPDMPALTVGLAGGFVGTEDLPPFVGVQPCLADTPAQPLGNGPIDGSLTQGQDVSARNTTNAAPYYRFTLNSPQGVSIRAENQQADPYIYVFDGNGTLLAENDDSEGLNSRIDFTNPLQPGTYCIGMRALSDPDLPVTVTVSPFDQAIANQELYAFADAAPPPGGSYPVTNLGVLPNVSLRDVQVPGRRAVFFSFEMTTPSVVVFTADEISDSDPWIRLFDASGALIDDNDDANGTLNSELVVRLQRGRYTVGVRQYSSDYNGVIRIGMTKYVPAQ